MVFRWVQQFDTLFERHLANCLLVHVQVIFKGFLWDQDILLNKCNIYSALNKSFDMYHKTQKVERCGKRISTGVL